MNINLDNIFPSDDSYIYTFTISNEKDGNRAEGKQLNVYSQRLPLRKTIVEEYTQEELENGLINDQRIDDDFPYIIVALNEGSIENESSAQEVSVLLYIGVYDNAENVNGHKDIINIIEKIYERFAKNPVLAKRYVFKYPMTWALQDEKEDVDTYPYFFGGIEMKFETYAMVKEDPLAWMKKKTFRKKIKEKRWW